MQLLDRYLTAVKFWLPKAQRDDIAAELAANLQAEIDDRAAALGRPLTDDEIAALLKPHGSPLLAASRYHEGDGKVTFGRQLIGPVVFPFYWLALKVTLLLLLIPAVVPALSIDASTNYPREMGHIIYRMGSLALPTLFFVTLAFAAFDLALHKFHYLENWSRDWDPRKLPSSDRQLRQIPRFTSLAGIVVQSIVILWLLGHSSIPYLVLTHESARLFFAPIWASLYLPILLVSFICLAQHWINLVEPDWYWLPPVTGLLTSILGLLILYRLLGSHALTSFSAFGELPAGAGKAPELRQLLTLGLVSLWYGILVVGAIYAWRLAWLAWQSLPRADTNRRPNGIAHT